MAIELKISNSLESLADEWCRLIRSNRSVFRPVYVVTQTEGMNNWLKEQAAGKLGIAANIEFLRPNDFIHLVYKKLGGRYPNTLSTHDLNWLIFKALGENSFKAKYPYISGYYKEDELRPDVKKMSLAIQTADLFDQYQIYRADMIEKWNGQENSENWQEYLWKRVRALSDGAFWDKTQIGVEIKKALDEEEKKEKLEKEIPEVYFFGLSLITGYHLRLISEISRFTDVFFLIQNPSPETYWFEDKSEKVMDFLRKKGLRLPEEESQANPLLVNWGRVIQNTFMMLFEYENALNNYYETDLSEPPQDSLLHSVQNSIWNNERDNLHFSESLLADGTITINSCFSPMREVEVLYNYLVHLIDKKEAVLSPRDIVVMVSDIDLFASYIRAVFDNAPYKFYYNIADESYALSDSISNTLVHLLQIGKKNFTSENVLSLLEFSELRNNFRIPDRELPRRLTEAANIRFGIEGKPEDESVYVSWEYGLRRIMYGLCISGEPEVGKGERSFFPIDRVEGFQTGEAVRFVYFVETLIQWIKEREWKRSIGDWVKYVEKGLQFFLGERENSDSDDYLLVLKKLRRYNILQDVFAEKVSFDVFIQDFLPYMNDARKRHSYVSGGITFCSLIPMRSIPFKVVGLLGMDFDKFPRKDKKLSFDLMRQNPRRGDRNLKENDKHLFLETLLSAGEYLYISYIGRSVKNNSKFPPAAPVEELLDFLASHSEVPEKVREDFIKEHPLHSFSRKYNSDDENLFSYLTRPDAKENIFQKDSAGPEIDFTEISLKTLIDFFTDAIKVYYNKVLNVYYEEEEKKLSETEIFDLNNLQKWKYRYRILEDPNPNLEVLRAAEVKKGGLPLKNMGKIRLKELEAETEWMKEKFTELSEGKTESPTDIDLEIDDVYLRGKLYGIYGEKLIAPVFSKGETKYKFEFYLKILLLRASGNMIEGYYLSNENKEIYKAADITEGEAKARLESMVKLYKIGMQELIPFSLDFKIEPADAESFDAVTFANHIAKNYIHSYPYPCNNLYHIGEFRDGLFEEEGTYEKYKVAAKLALEPMEEFLIPLEN